ncbi:DUF4145 domain-containing protein [Kocuria marina]|uniref:DUF4145 domain-containing protein n=1 Tax=Kocuria marina TaxID=223184 RepID=UPI003F2032C8
MKPTLEEGPKLQASFYRCPGCSSPSIGITELFRGAAASPLASAARSQDVWLPHPTGGHVYDDVPNPIASAADEAHQCHEIGAHRGSIILARAVIEATCKDKGAEGRNLLQRIDALHEMGLVGNQVRQEADEIKDSGNEMAHGDFHVEATAQDSEEILAFMGEVLGEVYQRPARVAARRAERQKRKNAKKSDGA